MIKIKTLFLLVLMIFTNSISHAESVKSLVLYYDEVEEGVGVQSMRYLINNNFLRIDNGDEKADFILFDVNKKLIFSINHEDQTVLKIEYHTWKKPVFDFKSSINETLMSSAPKVFNKPVYNYQLKADDQVCTQVFMIKNTYPQAMQVMYAYQQVLSGQQVATLDNTPKEMHTPCFLLDQVYHQAEYYKSGLPVQISYSRGYAKLLKDFKEQSVDTRLFEIPAAYKEYKPFSH